MAKTSPQRNGTSRQRRTAQSVKSSRTTDRPGRSSLTKGQSILIAFSLPFLVLTLAMPLRTFAQQRADLAETREEIALMEQRVVELEAQKEKYSDPAYVEEQARIRLGLIKPGETPYRLLDPALSEGTTAEPEELHRQPAGPWYGTLWRSISEPPKTNEVESNPGRDQATDPSSLPTVPE